MSTTTTAPRDHLADAVWLTRFAAMNGYGAIRPLPARPGWYGCLAPLLFTWAIIAGEIGDEYTVGDRWCFHSLPAAMAALEAWNGQGEPQGWHRHPFTGRRRPEGNAAQEYVDP